MSDTASPDPAAEFVPVYVDWWAKYDDGRAAAGGYLRCDTAAAYVEFAMQLQERGLVGRVSGSRDA